MTRLSPRLGILLAGLALAVGPSARGDGRTAEQVLADYRAVVMPRAEPGKQDAQSVREFRAAYGRADARRADLALELFDVAPDHDQVPALLLARWPQLMLDHDRAGTAVAEIDRALPHFKDPKRAREARFIRAIATITASPTPEAALPAVDAFIRDDPKDPMAVRLLAGWAASVKEPAFRAALNRRIVAEYPESPAAKSAAATLALLDRLGKPIDLEFVDAIGGKPVSIAGLKGKVVVLDFWATWCGPCVAELPKMKELYAKYRDQGVEFIGVSLDKPKEEGGLDQLKAFVAKSQIPWPQYYQGDGFDGAFSSGLGIDMIPQVFLVDAQGNLANLDARGKLDALLPEYLAKAKAATAAARP